jgi:hypothetical protein
MKDNNYVRFCCSNHVRENIKKAFGKKTGNDFKNAVLSHDSVYKGVICSQ